jgi:hypothetical protein
MQRDVLLLTEMTDAAEQAQALADGVTAEELAAARPPAEPDRPRLLVHRH